MKRSISIFKLTSFAAILLALSMGFFSCEKENVNTITEEEDNTTPTEEAALTFRLAENGQETTNISQALGSNEECLFGQFTAGSPGGNESLFMIGYGNTFQVFWTTNEFGPHTYVSELDDPTSFLMHNPCADELGDVVTLQNFTVVLEEVGAVGGVMTGTFEGEKIDVETGDITPVSLSFSVERIE